MDFKYQKTNEAIPNIKAQPSQAIVDVDVSFLSPVHLLSMLRCALFCGLSFHLSIHSSSPDCCQANPAI